MRTTIIIAIAICVIGLLAAAGWRPSGALAGPLAQAGAPTPSNQAAVVKISFTGTRSAGSSYADGERIRITVKFDRVVTVTGAPYVNLQVGAHQRPAAYSRGSGTQFLRFAYRVQSGDFDGDGVSVPAGAVNLNGGTIRSTGRDATLTHDGIPADDTRTVNDAQPTFGTASVAKQNYTTGSAISLPALPAATSGNAPLTYSLTTPPDGLTFNAVTRVLSGTPTAGQTATAYTYTVTDADGDTATLSFTIAITADYDADDDQLLDVANLSQLDAIRYDLDGNGAVDTGTADADAVKYAAAFPNPIAGMGCQLVDHDEDATTAPTPVCTGYELTQNLDFDTDDDGATYTVSSTGVITGDSGDTYYNGGKGWAPIGTYSSRFTAAFDGNGKTISNLFIKDTARSEVGLFGAVGTGGRVERVGLLNLNITARNDVGGLVGRIDAGVISGSYATGSVTGSIVVGGLVGRNAGGAISASYATSSVTGSGTHVGGLVGENNGPISNSYATGSVTGSSTEVGGLAGGNSGIISGSYATGSVTGNSGVGGLVGTNGGAVSGSYAAGAVSGAGASVGGLVGWNNTPISSSYATGSVAGNDSVGGLIGSNRGAISGSYATGPATGNNGVGGLAGWTTDTISASYAAGPVTGNSNVGGLVGWNPSRISASYAVGAVKGTGNNVGGLVGSNWAQDGAGAAVNSYWNTGATGQSTSAGGGTGKTTRELQSLTGYTGIYANWNANLDGVAGNDDPWEFGKSRQYPVLKYGGQEPAKQRQTSIQSDNWNAPVVGEPVTAGQSVTDDANVTWQWQSSADGATWTNIANATTATYIPVAADAAGGGKFLRAQATFTVSGDTQTLTTVNTAKVIAATTATAARTTAAAPMVGLKLRYQISGVTAANRTNWRWQRCDDAAMTTNCQLREQSNPIDDAHTEYTPAAGTDTDVGKYLRAYVYYADSGNSNAWTRTQTPVLGPVVAAAPAPTTP